MTRLPRYWLSHPLLSGLLLAALALRAIIPVGYMPSSEHPFALTLCQVGLPATASLDHADLGGDAQSLDGASATSCTFGGAPSAGPAPDFQPILASLAEISTRQTAVASVPLETRRYRVTQPRAPPVFS